MSRLLKIIWLLVIVALIVVGVVFSLLNNQPVPLDLFFVVTPPVNLSLVVFAAFGIGLLAGMLITSFTVLRVKVSAQRQQRKLAREVAASSS